MSEQDLTPREQDLKEMYSYVAGEPVTIFRECRWVAQFDDRDGLGFGDTPREAYDDLIATSNL